MVVCSVKSATGKKAITATDAPSKNGMRHPYKSTLSGESHVISVTQNAEPHRNPDVAAEAISPHMRPRFPGGETVYK
jgi:hypothetical protein